MLIYLYPNCQILLLFSKLWYLATNCVIFIFQLAVFVQSSSKDLKSFGYSDPALPLGDFSSKNPRFHSPDLFLCSFCKCATIVPFLYDVTHQQKLLQILRNSFHYLVFNSQFLTVLMNPRVQKAIVLGKSSMGRIVLL